VVSGRSARGAQLAAFDPPPDVDGAEGAGAEDVVDEEELSFDDEDDEEEPSLEEAAPSEALALLRLSVR
jgi:hypothetical protein